MTRPRLIIATALLCTACVAEAPEPPPPPVSLEERAVGCYQVVSFEWTSPKPVSYRGEYDPPALFFLSRNHSPIGVSDRLWQVRAHAPHLGLGYWRLTDDSAIQVTWSTRLDTLAGVRLTIRGDATSEVSHGHAESMGGFPVLRWSVVVRKVSEAACDRGV